MDKTGHWWLCGFLVGTAYITWIHDKSFALGRPVQTAIGCLSALTFLLFISGRAFPRLYDHRSLSRSRSTYIPLANSGSHKEESASKETTGAYVTLIDKQWRLSRLQLGVLACAAAALLRIECARWTLKYTQCTSSGWEVSVNVYMEPYQHKSNSLAQPFIALASAGTEFVWTYKSHHPTRPARWRALLFLAAVCISLGCSYTFVVLAPVRSTHICPLVSRARHLIPLFQISGSVLDFLIIKLLSRFLTCAPKLTMGPRSPQVPFLLASTCLVCNLGLLVEGFWLYWGRGEYRQWLALLSFGVISPSPVFCMVTSFTAFCGIQLIIRVGVTSTILLGTAWVALSDLCITAITEPSTYQLSFYDIQAAAITVTLGAGILMHYEPGLHPLKRDPPRNAKAVTSILNPISAGFAFQLIIWAQRSGNSISAHPIDILIKEAETVHSQWEQQAMSSVTLPEAAAQYRKRYHRNPPPRFDRWFNYATLQGVRLFDDYDMIYNDLMPFWSIPPIELRLRTIEAISNPWNLVGGIFIRQGRPYIAPFAPQSHQWMLEGIAEMLQPFSRWLPDMEMAFNLNDESRVSLPFTSITKATEKGLAEWLNSTHGSNSFGLDRGDTWMKLPDEPHTETRFVEGSFENAFRKYGSIACSPKSKATQEYRWNDRSLCTSCAAPHLFQQFLSNWTLAGDPCHQPDLERLHGTYIAPSTIRNTHDLMPIFSQSKSHGYNDILYPSPWNYEDKAVYAPTAELPDLDWSEKLPTLFWRGSTTEGFSPGNGAWQHIGRQRLVHMMNNATDSGRYAVLLPQDSSQKRYQYRILGSSKLRETLATDVRFVKVERCWGGDCEIQAEEFAIDSAGMLPFQTHWRHKYLFDIDGAGFSGRFLPFLNSKSLPFKSAIMREWWDGRLTPWKHFVPVDTRLTEVWSLLAYFQGWKEGSTWLMKPHDAEAEKIANDGREWAKQTLTKGNMEAYLFRLLLEWARLTDDDRDRLGYAEDLE